MSWPHLSVDNSFDSIKEILKDKLRLEKCSRKALKDFKAKVIYWNDKYKWTQ